MKKLLLALCLVPSISFAQSYTPYYGCFVENYSSSCSQRDVICDANPGWDATNLYYFGYTIGTLCNNYVQTEINRRDWVAYGNNCEKLYKKNSSLIKKLRAACGAKCKRIK